jgi:hypothetical protein
LRKLIVWPGEYRRRTPITAPWARHAGYTERPSGL